MDTDIIKTMRDFNRYYTVWLDVMNKGYLGTEFSWPESRVLFEIHLYPGINATELCEHLNMDKSYISRILAKFEKDGLLTRELVSGSKGMKRIRLTEAGKKEAELIDRNGDRQIIDKLKNIDEETCKKLCEAMIFIEETLRNNDKEGLTK